MGTQIFASLIMAMIAFWGTFQLYGRVFATAPVAVESVTLEEAIEAIKRELARIAATPGETAGLVLQTATVELMTQRADSATSRAALAVPVFEAASLTAARESRLTSGSKMTVVFVAPSGGELLAMAEAPFLDLSTLVLAARQALLATRSGDVQLAPKSVEIAVNFVLVHGTDAGAAFKAHVVDIGGTASQVDTAGNRIVLAYVDPALASRGTAAAPVPPR